MSERLQSIAIHDFKGDLVQVPIELLYAFDQFICDPKPSGSITIHFKKGSIAGIETNTRKVLK